MKKQHNRQSQKPQTDKTRTGKKPRTGKPRSWNPVTRKNETNKPGAATPDTRKKAENRATESRSQDTARPTVKPAVPGRHDREEMAAILEHAGIRLSEYQLGQLWSYHTLLREHNTRLNMTRIHNFKNMIEKLYVDSILPGQLIRLPSPLLDIGTGPGMPGIPLKIAFPEIRIILAESRQNRVTFLETAVTEIGLANTPVMGKLIHHRFDIPVSGIITRAVEHIGKTLERIEGCLAENGLAVFMKGPGCTDEIASAGDRFAGQYNLLHNIDYKIPHTPHERRLVVFERKSKPLWQVKEKIMADDRFREIESEQNPTFRDLKKLLNAKGIKKQNMAVMAGKKLVHETISRFKGECLAWISTVGQSPPPEKVSEDIRWYMLTPQLFRELDVSGTNNPLLLIKTPVFGTWQPEDGFAEGCSVMIPFQDPDNVGAVIRSAIAFGAKRIILLSEAAHPFHPKALRASGGAVFHGEFYMGPSINDIPPDLPVVCLSGEGMKIADYEFPDAFGLLPGVEGSGLPQILRKNAVSIPISDHVESLNAATATAIALYEWAGRK